jgi:hypothetical protein
VAVEPSEATYFLASSSVTVVPARPVRVVPLKTLTLTLAGETLTVVAVGLAGAFSAAGGLLSWATALNRALALSSCQNNRPAQSGWAARSAVVA